MKIKVKKIYKDAVRQLEKHQVEISTALQVIAIAASARTMDVVSEEEEDAREEIANMYAALHECIEDIIEQIDLKIWESENADD